MCLCTIYKCTGYEYYCFSVNLFMMRFTNEYFRKKTFKQESICYYVINTLFVVVDCLMGSFVCLFVCFLFLFIQNVHLQGLLRNHYKNSACKFGNIS